ncbi:MAG: tetratricopeptide repeat protein [Muribaculaceae bacterium]|nr:tetratricopeptide repeat protein [Muribaculaceae bacterium]
MKAFCMHKTGLVIVASVTFFVGLMLWILIARKSESHSVAREIAQYSIEFSESLGEEGEIFSDSLKNLLTEPPQSDSIVYRSLRTFSRKLFENGLQTKAFEYLKTCIELIDHNGRVTNQDNSFKAKCYLLLGAAADEVGLRSLSQDYYFTGLKIADKYDVSLVGDFFNNIGVSYLRTGKIEEAIKYYNKALEISFTRPDRYLSYIVYINLAEVSAREGNHDKAIDYALKAIQCVDENSQSDEYYSAQAVIGQLYACKKDTAMALAHLKNAYIHQQNGNNPYYLFDTCLTLASLFADNERADSAAQYIRIASDIATETGNPDQRVSVLNMEAAQALVHNRLLEAYNIQNKIITLKDSIYREENAARIKQAHDIYNIERETDIRNTGISSWNPVVVFVSMAVLVGVLIIFIVWILTMKRKKELAVAERARAIAELNELQTKQLREEKEIQQKIKSDLELHERKLTSFTLDRIHTSQQIEEVATSVRQTILDLPLRDKQLRDRLKEIVAQLAALKTDTQWEEFQYYFERVHPEFYKCLDEQHPGLTVKDRRLCALLSLGLSTKDIASLTFREVRSVESARNRLRKKLGLEVETNLVDYILSLSRSTGAKSNC